MSCSNCQNSTATYCRICNPMTVYQFASLGGKARAKKLSPSRRKEIARKGGLSYKKLKPIKVAPIN